MSRETKGVDQQERTTKTRINQPSHIMVGHCPTMTLHKNLFDDQLVEFRLVYSSAEALALISQGVIDVALIGRQAYQEKLVSNINEKRLRDGPTLVGVEGGVLSFSELANSQIHTHLDLETDDLFPAGTHLVQHQELSETLANLAKTDSLALILWSEYQDELPLVIPMDGEQKTPIFRSPHIYYSNDLEQQIDEILTI